MDVRVGNGGALVEGHHVLLGQRLSGFSATSGSGAALQGADDCSGWRLFVVVEVVLGKLDQLESLLFDVLPVGLSVFVSGLLLGLTWISRLILTWVIVLSSCMLIDANMLRERQLKKELMSDDMTNA